MRRISAGVIFLAAMACAAMAQGVSANVNMVACTPGPNNQPCPWPQGDPFLERQNEPSLAVSSRNPAHLVGGANDYRTVDIPGMLGISETGDVWVGLYKSSDNGATWRSTLLPGYPLDHSPEGMASPVKGLQAAADPTVRAHTNGLFYYSFIAFNRDPKNPLGVVAVARMVDNNNKENFDPNKPGSDPIQYLSTSVVDTGTAGQFLDKSWIVTDIPRAGAGNCTINGKSFPIGAAYLTYSVFTGSDAKPGSKIMLVKSTNCGVTWSNPIKISESNQKNQGTVSAVDPRNGNLYVAWRRSASSNLPDAIVIAKSTDGGASFTKAIEVQTFVPDDATVSGRKSLFDQPKISVNGVSTSFRAKAFPAMTVDGAGRVYVAWSQRGLVPAWPAAARIVIATSTDGVTWTSPAASQVVVDPNQAPVPGTYYQGPYYGAGGHQFMPSLATANGVVMVAFYDSREDHTTGIWQCINPSTLAPDATLSCPSPQRVEVRVPVGNLAAPASPGTVFNDYIADIGLGGTLKRRHTMDVRAAQAFAGNVPSFAASVRVSQYKFGARPGSSVIEQLQVNPPNFPMFIRGTSPFVGDYIDLATVPFVSDGSGNWSFNTGTQDQPVFHATWGDNRDVRPPANGDWTNFTPAVSNGDSPAGSAGGASLFGDPSNPIRPLCTQGQSGIRNQNVYTAKISQGVVVTSKGNSKQITSFTRAYTMVVQNTTYQCKSFRLTLPAPTGATTASFAQLFSGVTPLTTLDVTIAPRSSIAREIYIKSTLNRPNVKATATALPTNGSCAPSNLSSLQPAANAISASFAFNSDPSSADISSADISSADISSADISTSEVYLPSLSSADITSADISSADITNPEILSADISSADIANPDIASASIASADISSADISSADISSADISSADISGALGDVTWSITNRGNTSASFNTKLFLKGALNRCVPQNCGTPGQVACTPGCSKFQLIVYKRYRTPVSSANGGCTLMSQFQNQIITNVIDPTFLTSSSSLTSADITSADISNATVALAPGEDAQVTVRVLSPTNVATNQAIREAASFAQIAEALSATVAGSTSGSAFTPVGGAQAVGTSDAAAGITIPATTLTVVTTALPDGITGQSYSASIEAVGGNIGTNNLTWSATTPLPAGIQIATGAAISPVRANGILSGAPTSATSGYSFTVQVVDAPNVIPPPQQTATQTLSIRVGNPLAIQPATIPDTTVNTPVTFQFASSGGLGVVTWTPVALPGWLTLSGTGQLSGTPALAGTYNISIMAADSSCLISITACQHQSATAGLSIKVSPRKTSTLVTFSKNPVVVNEAVSITATVTDIDSGTSATPAGSVTFGDGSTCTISGSGVSASCSISSSYAVAGSQNVSATYNGSTLHAGSTDSKTLVVNTRSTSTTLAINSPTVIVGQPATLTVTVTDTQIEGTKATPAGQIAFSSSTATDSISSCTLSASAAPGVASCSVALTAQTAGVRNLRASFAATTIHSNSSGLATLTVNPRPTTISVTVSPSLVAVGTPATVSVTVTDTGAFQIFNPSGTIALGTTIAGDVLSPCVLAPATPGVSTCAASVTPLAVGTRTISASFTATPVHAASGPATANLVAKYAITLKLTSSAPNPSVPLQPVAVQFTGSYTAPVAPTGTLSIADTDGDNCTAAIGASGSCTLTPGSTGTKTLTASYAGDANFLPAQATASQVVQPYGFTGFDSPLNGTESYSGAANLGSAVAVKWELADAGGAPFLTLASAKILSVVFTGRLVNGACPVSSQGQAFVIYAPTTGATGGSTFRLSTSGYIFNWDTSYVQSAGAGCYTILLNLADGTTKRTSLNLR